MSDYFKNLKENICIEYPLAQSQEGRYFIGQTPILIGKDQHALAALSNPFNSNVNIYVNAITITNTSNLNLSAEFYLKASFNQSQTSNLVSCTNLSIVPEPNPSGKIKYLSTTNQPPIGGVPIFTRIISPYSTSVVDGGQIIISPGESLVVYLGGILPIGIDSTIVAFGWWEEKNFNCCGCHH